MFSIGLMLLRTLALLLATSVALAGIASASANPTSHCVSSAEQVDAQSAASDAQTADDGHTHVAALPQNMDGSTTDCMPHFCPAVLIGPGGYGAGSLTAMLMVMPEPQSLRALLRIRGLYRPPSL